MHIISMHPNNNMSINNSILLSNRLIHKYSIPLTREISTQISIPTLQMGPMWINPNPSRLHKDAIIAARLVTGHKPVPSQSESFQRKYYYLFLWK